MCHGPCTRTCFSSSSCKSYYASQLLGGSSSLFRALYWIWRRTSNHTSSWITLPSKSPHFRPITNTPPSTHFGLPRRNSIKTHCEPWTSSPSHHSLFVSQITLRPTTSLPSTCWFLHHSSSTHVAYPHRPHPEPRPLSAIPNPPSRTTIPVPVRSKQRSRTMDDPQPKKKSKAEETPVSLSTNPHGSTHRVTEATPPPIPENDDSDDSDSAYSHRLTTLRANKAMSAPSPWPPWGKTTSKASPTLAPTPPVAITSTVTLTPNPNDTTPIADPSEETKAPVTTLPTGTKPILDRPWTASDDAQLTSMKQDTRSRPSWKTIGARLERDPQLCKMRWALLKRADEEGRIIGPIEPETGDWAIDHQGKNCSHLFANLFLNSRVYVLAVVSAFCYCFRFFHCYVIISHLSAIMVHSSRQTQSLRERSRSRDDSIQLPMWQPHPSTRANEFRDSWQEVPRPEQHRDVLIFVCLKSIPDLMRQHHDNIMHWTSCDTLPLLGRQEEHALFTFSVLLTKERLETFTV